MEMADTALLFICVAILLHLGRTWLALTRDRRAVAQATKLRLHLDWTNPDGGPSRKGRAARKRRRLS